MSERDEFEAWAKADGYQIDRVPSQPSLYNWASTQCCWEAWQAARAPQAVPALMDRQVTDKPLWQSYLEQQVEKDLQVIKKALSADDYAADFDDLVVDQFAVAMKTKLAKARDEGRCGWQQCKPADLSRMLREHVEKGDPCDVANFCMFLWSMGKPISAAAPQPSQEPEKAPQRYQD